MVRRIIRETGRFVAVEGAGGEHVVRVFQQFTEIVSRKGIKVEPTSRTVHQLANGDLVVAREGQLLEVIRTRELLRRP